MVDFSAMLQKSPEALPKPPALPVGNYGGTIIRYEFGDKNKNNTPYCRVFVKLHTWPDEVPEDERAGRGSLGQLSRDYYLRDKDGGDGIQWMLAELLRSCGLSGRPMEELIPELNGKEVIAGVKQYINEKTSEIGNDISRLTGQGG
jgi:hypothetical protein